MAGKIKQIIDTIIEKKGQMNITIENCIRVKLALKGINSAKYDQYSDDIPEVIEKLETIASEMNVEL